MKIYCQWKIMWLLGELIYYQNLKSRVDSIKVIWRGKPKRKKKEIHVLFQIGEFVNDAVELTVALMSAFNECLTRKEDELQDVLQVVEAHRMKFPNSKNRRL
jgi:hypothetical protein